RDFHVTGVQTCALPIYDGLNDGLSVAAKIGYSSETVHKTLVTAGLSKQPYVFVIPVNAELDLKMAAKAAKEKVVEMIPSKDILEIGRASCRERGWYTVW